MFGHLCDNFHGCCILVSSKPTFIILTIIHVCYYYIYINMIIVYVVKVTVLHMSLEVSEDNIAAFRQSLKSYVEHVTSESGCLQ